MSGSDCWFRLGADLPLQVLIFEPLFEEANRTRRMIATMMRNLLAHGIGSAICELPGTGESLTDIADVRFTDWHAAAKDAGAANAIASFRGGALIDSSASARAYWRFAPETGARIVRDLLRIKASGASALYAGHALDETFIAEIQSALPGPVEPVRTVRLSSDAADADARVEGTPLWRRAEPGEDPALSAALAADLAAWVKQCAAA